MDTTDHHGVIDYLLRHVADAFGQQLDQVIQEQIGLGLSQYQILRLQRDRPRIRQSQIAQHLGQTEAAVSRQTKLMLERGLLVSAINPTNRREHVNHPTPKGLKMLENTEAAIKKHTISIFDGFGDKQQKQLVEMLTALHGKICLEGKPFACDHPFEI